MACGHPMFEVYDLTFEQKAGLCAFLQMYRNLSLSLCSAIPSTHFLLVVQQHVLCSLLLRLRVCFGISRLALAFWYGWFFAWLDCDLCDIVVVRRSPFAFCFALDLVIFVCEFDLFVTYRVEEYYQHNFLPKNKRVFFVLVRPRRITFRYPSTDYGERNEYTQPHTHTHTHRRCVWFPGAGRVKFSSV